MYHSCVDKIKNLIEQNNLWHEYFEHEPVRTSEEAARIRSDKYSLEHGAKALLVRVKAAEKFFAMFVLPGHLRFDIAKAKSYFGAKDIRFATEQEVAELTGGIEPGGVPPFGNLFELKVFADQKLWNNQEMIFNAGDKRVSIALKTADYKTLVNPTVVDIT